MTSFFNFYKIYCVILYIVGGIVEKDKKIIFNIIKVLVVILLIYCSCVGMYYNESYISESEVFLYGSIRFFITAFCSMIVPFMLKLICSNVFKTHKGKTICFWNSFIVLVIFMILDIILMGGIVDEVFVNLGTNLIYTLGFYFINKWIYINDFVDDRNKSKNTVLLCSNCRTKLKKVSKFCPKCGCEFEDEKLPLEKKTKKTKKDVYCKKCGGKINNDKKCTKCGKQYLKVNLKCIIPFVLISILFVISAGVNIVLYKQNKVLGKDNLDLIALNKSLEKENEEIHSNLFSIIGTDSVWYVQQKINFYDDNAVFVLKGYGNYYYSYDCVQKITNGQYSFWIYNEEAAISQGYWRGTC